MHTKRSLINDINKSGIKKNKTLLIHSSMKAIGEVEGGADTVLDAFISYMKDGLLLFPTHSWSEDNLANNIYNPKTEPSCVGILTNLFMKKEGALRSMHPTHSVTAMGKRAKEYILRDSGHDVYTPCPRNGCFGGLYDEDTQILFLGAPLTKNTYIHVLEEVKDIPNRINPKVRNIKLIYSEDDVREVEFYGHHSTLGTISDRYGKLLLPMLDMDIAKEVKIGDATSCLVDVKPMTDWVLDLLEENRDLFSDYEPLI